MEKLNLPDFQLSIRQDGTHTYIFDIIRKKYLVLTPEEWVRQNFVHYLAECLGYPPSLMMTENGMKLYNTQKRSDIVIYSRNAKPLCVVECKATDIRISQETFNQVARYNINFRAPVIMVTNGISHYSARYHIAENRYEFLHEIPTYQQILEYDENDTTDK
ncbi:MAG: type I restriction enzyme HsdR N-terminal domain-containing protein [Bacteroidales bacterium]|nr:type I restriction enzyme HsdR N-terminal domain-containing protein [Bacteroidales bacterium]